MEPRSHTHPAETEAPETAQVRNVEWIPAPEKFDRNISTLLMHNEHNVRKLVRILKPLLARKAVQHLR